jgi:hypothetical protein
MFVHGWRVPRWEFSQHPMLARSWIPPQWNTFNRWKRLVVLPFHFAIWQSLCLVSRFLSVRANHDNHTDEQQGS